MILKYDRREFTLYLKNDCIFKMAGFQKWTFFKKGRILKWAYFQNDRCQKMVGIQYRQKA